MTESGEAEYDVLRFPGIDGQELIGLLAACQIPLCLSPDDQPVPGSFCSDEVAGLVGNRLYLRADAQGESCLVPAKRLSTRFRVIPSP